MKKNLKKNQFLINNFGIKTNLKYIKEAENNSKNLRYVNVLCVSCGKECVKQYASIMAGTITSCGNKNCKVHNNTLKKKKYNIGDKVTDNFTYVCEDIERTTNNHRYFKVKCDCGKIVSTRLDTLKNQCKDCKSKIIRETITESHKKTLIRTIYGSYKKNAISRGYSFDLDLEYFENLIFSNCHYCGCEPNNKTIRNYKHLFYNGVDRKDNLIGYNEKNCVTCCGRCNMMKNKFSYNDFINHIKNIINNLKL